MSESDGAGRRLMVSNRLPFEIKAGREGGAPALVPASGGLVRALDSVLRSSSARGLWFGWPGESHEPDAIARATADLPYEVVPIALEPEVVAGYYDGFSNRTLWPLFHDLLGRTTFEESYWRGYVEANERFAAAVADRLAPGDVVWAHDFHLLTFARALRERNGSARCGLFLHVPFPPQGLFHRLPWRREIAEALLAYDTIGFQTARDVRAFGRTVRELLVDARPIDTGDREAAFEREGRVTRAGVFPVGIDFARWDALGRDAGIVRVAARFRHGNADRKIVLGVDRLDYSKGIAPRLRAFGDFLERHPEWRERVQFVQIAVPSRLSVKDYRELKKEIDGQIGQINGTYATPSWVPVNYINRSFSERDLAAYYRAADVALVTPIKDGMNLVAKEFCAASVAGRGVLVLSEFAGAAAELAPGALIVNPHDVTGISDAIHHALEMPEPEQSARLEELRATIAAADVHRWAERFLAELESNLAPLKDPRAVLDEWNGASAEKVLVVLDYDGTLVPIRPIPGMAAPTPELVKLLSDVAASPGVTLVLSSGRSLSELDAWFPDPRVVLVAGHGAAWRRDGEAELLLARSWSAGELDASRERLRAIFEEPGAPPGAILEDKGTSIAIHYRLLEGVARRRFVGAVREEIGRLVSERDDLRLLEGRSVLEVVQASVDKGAALRRVRRDLSLEKWPAMVLGDDATDEDGFATLAERDLAVHVGAGATRARLALRDAAATRELLLALVAARRDGNFAAEAPEPV